MTVGPKTGGATTRRTSGQALEWLDHSADDGFAAPTAVRRKPAFAPLRSPPAMRSIMIRVQNKAQG